MKDTTNSNEKTPAFEPAGKPVSPAKPATTNVTPAKPAGAGAPSTLSTAPAARPFRHLAAPAAASLPARTTMAPATPATAPAPAAKLAFPAATTASPTAKPAGSAAKLTTIEAKIDVGFGNALYLRGQGGGLSWDTGVPLNCIDGKTWRWTTRSTEKLTFKLLVNDSVWAQGKDLEVSPGQRVEVAPVF